MTLFAAYKPRFGPTVLSWRIVMGYFCPFFLSNSTLAIPSSDLGYKRLLYSGFKKVIFQIRSLTQGYGPGVRAELQNLNSHNPLYQLLLGSKERLIRWFALFCLLTATLSAGQGNLTVELGSRTDQFDWNIAAPSGTPNVLSELVWSDVQIVQLGLAAKHFGPGRVILQGIADYGWVVDGDVRDSDFLSNDRLNEFSRSIANAGDDYVADLSFGAGMMLCRLGQIGFLAPMAGYSYHTQKLGLQNGEQLIALNPATLGAIDGLDSYYYAQWWGPWLGVNATACLMGVQFDASYERHWCDYRAAGHWNLREDLLDDFQHTAIGAGDVVSLAMLTRYGKWIVGVKSTIQRWRTEPGVDRTFFELNTLSGPVPSFSDTRLNEVRWDSHAVVFTATTRFYP